LPEKAILVLRQMRLQGNSANPAALQNNESKKGRSMLTHLHAHGEAHIPGVTHDPILRPVGAVLIAFGAAWALFWGMAVTEGDYSEPKAAAALVLVGLLMAVVGKREQQI
jgi:hypothetical protein